MRLYEYEAKAIFSKFGIPIPQGQVVSSPEEAHAVAIKLNKPVALKIQVLLGSRGKLGGIKFAETPEEAEKLAKQLLGGEMKGFRVTKLLVEEKLEIARELYLGITIDDVTGFPIIIASSEGGIDVEEIAQRSPEKIITFQPEVFKGLREYEARSLIKRIGLSGSTLTEASNILVKLYQVFKTYDAELAEINPLVLTKDGRVVAADARLNIDDHALFRHPEVETVAAEHYENPLEFEGRKRGVNYVDLKGNIAAMGNGAGLVMMLLDTIKREGGEPACFLDTGGGLSVRRIEDALDLLLMKASRDKNVKVIFFAFWFMISPAEEAVEGFLNVLSKKKPTIPIIGVIQGVGAEQAIKVLENVGIKCYPEIVEGIKAAVVLAQR